MPKLQIVDIYTNNDYILVDFENQKKYKLNLRFYGLETAPKIGDTLGFHDELLDPNYDEFSTHYQFGPLDEVYGRKIESSKDIDCIMLLKNDKKTFLKRFFG
ncbi:MAG: hypothetical protein ACOX6H_03655 [Christensenellales bacterium]|mgnify:CR=1 FL=1|jgi:hypothetical protein